ncbi:hypothetical protein, partial [Paraburkholderia atlantica]|uniref:hypothetical protein n=1 Tax=Paraburkholderia atlantica TaxID=2654982 RepID=UPI001C37A19B
WHGRRDGGVMGGVSVLTSQDLAQGPDRMIGDRLVHDLDASCIDARSRPGCGYDCVRWAAARPVEFSFTLPASITA